MSVDVELHPAMKKFIRQVEEIVSRGGDETTVTTQVAEKLRELLKHRDEGIIPPGMMQPNPDKYVLYRLYVDPEDRFSIAAAVWNVGQTTPIHDHGTWGVIGIVQGSEYEIHYDPPSGEGAAPMVKTSESYLEAGDVTVCCTSEHDVHEVRCASSVPCVGIHVYGGDIGTIKRHVYDPQTGARRAVVTAWDPVPVAG